MALSLTESLVKSKPFIIGRIVSMRRFVCQQSPPNPRALLSTFERFLCKIFRDEQEIIIVSIKSANQSGNEAGLRDEMASELKEEPKK